MTSTNEAVCISKELIKANQNLETTIFQIKWVASIVRLGGKLRKLTPTIEIQAFVNSCLRLDVYSK